MAEPIVISNLIRKGAERSGDIVRRGWASPNLLAMIVFEKFVQHQPLNREAARYALEGVPMALSTMADSVGSVCTVLDC